MLRVRMLSGEVTSIPLESVSNVREVKQRLHQHHGLPPRFRQRLILEGATLDDAEELDSPIDLDLVVQTFSSPSQAQADELVAAARDGSVQQAGVYSIAGAKMIVNIIPLQSLYYPTCSSINYRSTCFS